MPEARYVSQDHESRRGWMCALLVSACLLASAAGAGEPWRPFLDGLRQRGMYDVAIVYLDRMAADPSCPADLKAVLDYEAGVTLIGEARASQIEREQEKSLDRARERLKRFLAEHPDHELTALATSQLANVLVERGRIRALRAATFASVPSRQETLLAEARKFFTEAQEAFEKARRQYAASLKSMGGAPLEGESAEKRQQLQRDLLNTRGFLARAIYEIGMTYPADDARRKKKLTEAAAEYASIYKDYALHVDNPLLAGYYGRLGEANCYQEMGQDKAALAIYQELLGDVEDTRDSHDLINRTLLGALETLVKPDVAKYSSAIDIYGRWEKNARGADLSSTVGLAIKCRGAEAYLERARALGEGGHDRKKMLREARRLFRSVSRLPGGHQAAAKKHLLDPLLIKPGDQAAEPIDFAAARDRADTARERMQAADLQRQFDERAGKTENLQTYEREIADARAEAIKYYRMALALAGEKTPLDQLNRARYYLAYLYWMERNQYDAAVLGEFIARRYSETDVARQAAKIAMAAWANLYNTSPNGPAKEFAQSRMRAVADYIAQRWPGGAEAGDAWIMLIHTAVVDGKIDTAIGYLEKLPADSAQRGEAEMMIGRQCWSNWVRAMRDKPDDEPESKASKALLARAESMLDSGIRKMADQGRIDKPLVAAGHALAQIYLQQNRPDEAVKLLDDPNVGLMTLVRANHPSVAGKGYEVDIYKTALRAYVAGQQLEAAEKVMDALEKQVAAGGDADAASRLTTVYLGLSRELQEMMRLLRAQQRHDELVKVSKGFELFLSRVAERKQGNTFASLAWVAGTFVDMAERFDPGGTKLTPEAKHYYQRAADVYNEILDRCKSEPEFASGKGSIDSVKVRLARCLRRLGRYSEANKLLVDVLRRRNRMVDAQVEAAYVLQDWAALGDASKYLSAIRGAYAARRKDGSRVNVVWGWAKLANLILRSQSRMATFHEARYNLALCRFKYALTLEGSEREKMLAQAAKEITVTQLLSPKLGGDARRRDYDRLLRKIQKLQGKTPVGFRANGKTKRE